MKSESYSVSSLISSSDQEPVLDKINQDVNTLLNQIKALQDEVRRKSTELTNANQRIVALVEINKRISRKHLHG
jgi:chaperonin cofactor prefoldin